MPLFILVIFSLVVGIFLSLITTTRKRRKLISHRMLFEGKPLLQPAKKKYIDIRRIE